MMNSSKNQLKKNNETMAELPASPQSPFFQVGPEGGLFFNEGTNLAFLALLLVNGGLQEVTLIPSHVRML
jgi:hypothetical protein